MRTIQISTAVFAAIWGARLDGEDSEDAILTRFLNVKPVAIEAPAAQPKTGRAQLLGFQDQRYGFQVPENFEIFRRFKGKEYRARASRWKWFSETDGKYYESLADLSQAIGAGSENAWAGWLCRPNGGPPVPIGTLRDPQTVQKRGRREGTLGDLKAIMGGQSSALV